MPLPVNLQELINGKIVEWERIEFKEGLNPPAVIHTMCAFANDFNNWGGGYIIIGVEEKDHKPVLPPKGLSGTEINKIQKELIGLCKKLYPVYYPVVEPVLYKKKRILILYCPGGQNRPYKAPVTLGKNSESRYYIRRFNNTVKAGKDDENELLSMAASVPFDDRINQAAGISDLNITLVKSFLHTIKSDLYNELSDDTKGVFGKSFDGGFDSTEFLTGIYRRMNLIEGPDEYIKPKNVSLLFFNENPEQYFSSARIEVVEFKDETGDSFTEKIFNGPLDYQIKSALNYIKDNILFESIHKIKGQAESLRFYNYPFEAIEEALVNAVYHRSYEEDTPVEIRIFSDRLEILSYPGPLPPLNKNNLNNERISARKYRNRRIGDILKELHLTEGRGTGFPKIRKSLINNGSPLPVFETDEDRTYFLTVLKVHPQAHVEAQVEAQVEARVELTETHMKILNACKEGPHSSGEIVKVLGHERLSGSIKKAVKFLLDNDLIGFTIPDKLKSRNQKYRITAKGMKLVVESGHDHI